MENSRSRYFDKISTNIHLPIHEKGFNPPTTLPSLYHTGIESDLCPLKKETCILPTGDIHKEYKRNIHLVARDIEKESVALERKEKGFCRAHNLFLNNVFSELEEQRISNANRMDNIWKSNGFVMTTSVADINKATSDPHNKSSHEWQTPLYSQSTIHYRRGNQEEQDAIVKALVNGREMRHRSEREKHEHQRREAMMAAMREAAGRTRVSDGSRGRSSGGGGVGTPGNAPSNSRLQPLPASSKPKPKPAATSRKTVFENLLKDTSVLRDPLTGKLVATASNVPS